MKPVVFQIPDGLAIPEGTSEGEEFESMATFQRKKDGRLCLVAIGDQRMPYDDDRRSNDGKEVARRYHEKLGDR